MKSSFLISLVLKACMKKQKKEQKHLLYKYNYQLIIFI